MTNEEVQSHYRKIRNALEGLETAALEPAEPLKMVRWSGALIGRVGEFTGLCLAQASLALTEEEEVTSR